MADATIRGAWKARPSEENDAKRMAILRAAAQAFREHGFGGTGMREIAKAAGLSPGNLYYYFKDKNELVAFCQSYALDRMMSAADEARRELDDPTHRLRAVIEAQIRCMLGEVVGAVAHLEINGLPADAKKDILSRRDAYEAMIRELVEEGIAAGAFRDCDAALVTRALLGAVNATVQWYHPDGPLGPDAIATTYSDYLIRGLEK